jgi:hypothetical protein
LCAAATIVSHYLLDGRRLIIPEGDFDVALSGSVISACLLISRAAALERYTTTSHSSEL